MQGTKDLTNGPIRKQLFNLAMPIMGTSFVQMAYSLTDMAWVGRLGSESVAAIGAVGILTWMTSSIALLTKVGSEVSVAQSIGARNDEDARNFSSHNLTIGLLIALCWGTILFTLAYPIIKLYKLDPAITHDAVSYLRIICMAFPFVFMSYSFTGIHNAAGLSKIPFYINGLGLIFNMLLDPLFIFGFGWGTDGAACATWISQGVVFGCFVYQLKYRNKLLGGFAFFTRIQKRYAKRIVQLGLPAALLNTIFAFINLVMGRTASTYGGHLGLMTLTTGGQIEAIAWNTSQGFSTALSAFTAQNYAARKHERITGAFRTTLVMTSIVGILCALLFIFWGSEIFSLIVPEPEAYRAGGIFLRIDGYSMPLMMLEITTQGLFYGSGRTVPPAIISITFNTLRIPLAILLSAAGLGVAGVWWAISISSMLKGLTSYIWFRLLQKRILRVS
ncbi:putative MATE family efflux protein [Parabacteroides sp. PF5-5]|uniref:MATE family efflux transporter n=1 Tax=unclassified Parabacteroides TaxID=2649774 RepID=UPI002474F092|nr:MULTISPECIES: MATE family efflux transporter [unclassified Parabacteroides]MDH6305697.1 putative MATE family efflux protein [Parabacteroides sp. PH5-39]MDH6316769.1 putative MATE family efflux protein [Parabacteroides sp. PF5-13]MDH6320410.1 putative MATE family efflux protein [Parabacteroides sp. PH5-13]MDH6324140.1 putative MATE family efflux protein [Parabacteroides sp. PH5-8]MDH6327955.1 putative MATE family efflux protein [Parabacteroides sp. PH5-41]